jgi:membrane protease YdiL (CAAX protease family)
VVFVAVVGFFAYLLGTFLLGQVIFAIDPGFASINDRNVQSLVAENYGLMFFGTVFLVPVAEEILYRGLLFRGLYDRRPILAWICSVAAFSAVHVLGYVGSASALTLVLCFVQYIPAGLILAWVYRRSGSIFASILMHAFINAVGMFAQR